MKRSIIFAASALLALGASALAYGQHSHEHAKGETKTIGLTGEVIDLTCFMQHPDNALGMEHAKCAKSCINKGLPVGFLGEDGTVYLLIGNGHEPITSQVADVMGRKVKIEGVVVTHHGVTAIQLVSVTAVK